MDAPTEVTAPTGAQVPPPGPRQLRRRPDDGHIAGVCAGRGGVLQRRSGDRPHRGRRAALQRPGCLRLRAGLDLRARRRRSRRPRRHPVADRPQGPGHPGLRDRADRPGDERVLGRLVGARSSLAPADGPDGARGLAPAAPGRRRRRDRGRSRSPAVHADATPRGVGDGRGQPPTSRPRSRRRTTRRPKRRPRTSTTSRTSTTTPCSSRATTTVRAANRRPHRGTPSPRRPTRPRPLLPPADRDDGCSARSSSAPC